MPRAALFLLAVSVWIYGVVDCARTDESSMPGRLTKLPWLALIVLLPVVGTIVWLVAIWPYRHPEPTITFGGGRRPKGPAPRPVAPDDDAEFLSRLDNQLKFEEWEREQRRREESEGDDEA